MDTNKTLKCLMGSNSRSETEQDVKEHVAIKISR